MYVSEKTKREAFYKCIVWFNDGNSRTFYSFDKSHRRARSNAVLGLKRLEKMLLVTFKGKWETAIIYINKPEGEEVAVYKYGRRVKISI